MTLKELAEILAAIRLKLIKIIVVIGVIWAFSFAFISDIVIIKIKEDLLPKGASLIYQAPLEGLILKLKISLIFGIIAVLPYLIYLSYKTLKTRTELLKSVNISRSNALIYGIIATLLFIGGVSYGYIIMLPIFLRFLFMSAQTQGVLTLYSISEFINFVVLMLSIFGIIFQMPLIMFFLIKNGITSLETFKYYRRYFYVGFFTIGAIITPPDVFTQIMVAVPMLLFFEISIIVVKILT